MAIITSNIRVTAADDFIIDAYWSAPEEGSQLGLILIMEAFGLNDHMHKVADRFAQAGYSVIMPALYDRIEKNMVLPYRPTDQAIAAIKQNGFDNPIADVKGCCVYLQQLGITRIGMVGFCYGGAVTWLASAQVRGIKAAVSYYGTSICHFPTVKPQCPTIAHWGTLDPSTPIDKVAVVAENNPEVTMYWYEANHGFNSDRPEYDDAAARLAWSRTLNHFQQNL